MRHLRALAHFGLLVAGPATLLSEVTLSPLISDHAVLQRDKPVEIWGWADPGEAIAVAFSGRSAATMADRRGHWSVQLPPLPANSTGEELTVTGKNTIVVHDVVVGEVWLCSGQSNMEMVLKARAFVSYRVRNAPAEIAAADFPLIRQFTVQNHAAERPAETLVGSWAVCSPRTAAEFSAVGYFFARELYRRLGVPVGIVDSSWGGTPIESWISPDALEGDPSFAPVRERWNQALAADPEAALHPRVAPAYGRFLGEKAEVAAGNAALAASASPVPGKQPLPRELGNPEMPGSLFNGMINPLTDYALRGVLWYQGESNAARADEYHRLFAAMIVSWRRHFAQALLPFYWVQLASYRLKKDKTDQTWAFLREAQAEALSLPETGQAVTIDIGDPARIHPQNKQEVGRRLALVTFSKAYGLPVDSSGPVFESAEREGGAMLIRFEHPGRALRLTDSAGAFELAGADRRFHPGVTAIEGDTLIVRSPEVPNPVAVRYAWRNAPAATLFDSDGLPAAPFRSDAW